MRQDDGSLGGALHRTQQVQQIGKIAILLGRDTIFKTGIEVVFGIEAGAPGLVGERRIGYHKVEGFQASIIFQIMGG